MKMFALAGLLALSLSTVAFAETPMPVPGGMPNNCSGASRNCDAGGMTTENALGTAANAQQQNVKTTVARGTGAEMPTNCSGATRDCNALGMTPENALGTAAHEKQQNVKTAVNPAPLDMPNDHTEKASQ